MSNGVTTFVSVGFDALGQLVVQRKAPLMHLSRAEGIELIPGATQPGCFMMSLTIGSSSKCYNLCQEESRLALHDTGQGSDELRLMAKKPRHCRSGGRTIVEIKLCAIYRYS